MKNLYPVQLPSGISLVKNVEGSPGIYVLLSKDTGIIRLTEQDVYKIYALVRTENGKRVLKANIKSQK